MTDDLFEQAAEGLDDEQRAELVDAVENLTDGIKILIDLRGELYVGAFLVATGRKIGGRT